MNLEPPSAKRLKEFFLAMTRTYLLPARDG